MRRASAGHRAGPLLRALALVVTSGLAVCGVKGPPRPPEVLQVETGGAADAGTGPIAADAGPRQ